MNLYSNLFYFLNLFYLLNMNFWKMERDNGRFTFIILFLEIYGNFYAYFPEF